MGKEVEADELSHINPFNVHGPTNPRYFANREDLLSTFRYNVIAVNKSKGITRPINISVMGSWGVGKTSTLLKFRDMLKTPGKGMNVFSATIPLSPECCVSSDIFFLTIMEGIFREYQSTAELPQRVRDFIRDELNFFERWRVRLSLNPELERKEPPPPRGIDFRYTMKEFWEKLQASGVGMAVIMLDDIHFALSPQGNADLLLDLKTNMQTLSAAGAQYMFIVTGPSSIYPGFGTRLSLSRACSNGLISGRSTSKEPASSSETPEGRGNRPGHRQRCHRKDTRNHRRPPIFPHADHERDIVQSEQGPDDVKRVRSHLSCSDGAVRANQVQG